MKTDYNRRAASASEVVWDHVGHDTAWGCAPVSVQKGMAIYKITAQILLK